MKSLGAAIVVVAGAACLCCGALVNSESLVRAAIVMVVGVIQVAVGLFFLAASFIPRFRLEDDDDDDYDN
ncbi:MAG: hypothetical protein ACKV0T_21825 [Planctomycetales bacterium]